MEKLKEMRQKGYRIYWKDYSMNTYMYGSEIQYEKNHLVIFQNPLMPSGRTIKEWYSMTNYQAKRIEPQLPILIEGKEYRLRLNLTCTPPHSVLVRLDFRNRQEAQKGFYMTDETDSCFSCPQGAYSYTMQLVQAGSREVRFQSIDIIPTEASA